MKKPKLYQPARQRMTVFSWIIILLLLTMYIFPLFYMVSTSLKTMYEVNLSPPRLLPSDPQWQNFAEAWRKMNFLHYLKNSVIVSVLTILGQLLVCVPCAYAFAKKQFRFKKFLNGLVLLTWWCRRRSSSCPSTSSRASWAGSTPIRGWWCRSSTRHFPSSS